MFSILVAIGIEAFNRFNEEAKELNSVEENEKYQDSSNDNETDTKGCWMHIKVWCMYAIYVVCYCHDATTLIKQNISLSMIYTLDVYTLF